MKQQMPRIRIVDILMNVIGKLVFVGLLGCPFFGHAQNLEVEAPKALRDDIEVEFYMEVADRSIRLILNPADEKMYYNTFEGDIYRITERGKSEKMYSVDDHGIHRLQGMIFHENDLYLSGNLDDVNDGLGTKGIVMRGSMQSTGERIWSVVAETVEHGGAQTTFDHGFNDLVVDEKSQVLLVNSGARTDHGEIQDNNDNYPGQRDVPTTAVILQIPLDAEGLVLTHNEQQVAPYIYARGVRNVYSMAFAPNGDLFGVSNSGDYDHPEDMFWLRQGHHYGFPWVMGGVKNPQQNPDWQADPAKDTLLPRFSHAFNAGYFYNDPDFPQMPEHLMITPSVQNLGPDADYFRDQKTGKIIKARDAGLTLGTFSPHRSPLGLFFDRDSLLIDDFRGDGFVIGHSSMRGGMARAFGGEGFGELEGRDLMHLDLYYSLAHDNYFTRTTRIVGNFENPTDALMIGNDVYVINHARGEASRIWKITLPAEEAGQTE